MPRSQDRREPRRPRGSPCPQRTLAMSERIGPSMSTEPGWMAARAERPPSYLGRSPAAAANDPSMLLSFERPASAGLAWTRRYGVRQTRWPAGVIRLSTVLENCTEATSAAIDKRRLKNGYHRALRDRTLLARGAGSRWARSPSR